MAGISSALRLRRAGAVFVGLVLLASCAQGGDPTPPSSPRSSDRTPTTNPGPTSSRKTGPDKKASANFCLADPPADWVQAEKDGKLPQTAGTGLRVGAVSEDGSRVFAIAESKAGSSLVMLQGKKTTKIYTLPDPTKSQLGSVEFDGQWLVFEHLLGFDIDAPWELYAWNVDAPKDKPERIAKRPKDSPSVGFFRFDLQDGRATWMQPRSFKKRDIHLYDLNKLKDRVLPKKMIFAPMLAGDLMFWQEQKTEGGEVTMQGINLKTQEPATIPQGLRHAGGSFDLVTDGRTWVWNSADFTKLYAWRTGWEDSITVRDDGDGNHFQYLSVSGDLVTYTDDYATFAADLEQHAYSPLTKTYGGAVAEGQAIAVNSPADKEEGKGQTAYVVDSSKLTRLPACIPWTPVPQPPKR